MNRRQRRAQGKERIEMVDLRQVVMPPQMTTAECAMIAEGRMRDNYLQTGHPYHHKTASGVIVEPDPTLEYLLSRMEQEKHPALATLRERADRLVADAKYIPKAVPVNRKYYGHDPFEKQ